MTQRQKQTQRKLNNKIINKDKNNLTLNNPQSEHLTLNQHQLTPIINQLRLLAGSVHLEQNTNLPKAFTLYFSDIASRLNQLNLMILKQQSTVKIKEQEISQLKLSLKGSKNDFAQMKSSLILQMQQQRTIADHLKQEIRLQRQRLSNTVMQLMQQAKKKDQQMTKLRQQSQEQMTRIKKRVSNASKNDEYQQSRKRVNSVYDRQKVQLVKSQQMKKQQQTEQFMNLLKQLNINVKTQQSEQIINYVERLFSKISELQLSILQRQQQIDTQVSFSYLNTSKTQMNGLLLSRKQQQIQELKQKILKLNRSMQGKDSQISDLRGMIQKYLRQKQQNNKYLGTKWEHQIERVMLNAEIEFDRQKNRIKRAGEERLSQVERTMGDKIQQLRQQNRNIRQNKLKKAIQRVRQLQINIKDFQQQKIIQHQNHQHQIDQLKKVISNLNNEYDQLSTSHKLSINNYQQQKLKNKQINHQLQYLKLTLKQKQIQLQNQNKIKLNIQKIQLQQQRSTFITTSKNTYDQIVNKFQQQFKRRQKQQQELFRNKYQELFHQVNKTKKEHQELYENKIKQIIEEKDDIKKAYQKFMRGSKQEQRSRNQQINKLKTKYGNQIKQLKDQINKKQQELLRNKQMIEILNKQKKNKDHNIKNKGEEINSLQDQIKSKQAQYNELQLLYHSLSREHQQLQKLYSNINQEILKLKNYFLKEHAALKEQHLKTQRNYKAYIRDLQDACFSSSDRNVYIRQIKRLKMINNGAETDLKNAENKIITMKQLSKYQSNKIERMETHQRQRERQEYTYRSQGKLPLDYKKILNFTERRATQKDKDTLFKQQLKIYKQKDRNSTSSLFKTYDKDGEISKDIDKDKDKQKQKQRQPSSSRYMKLSKIKAKTKNHFYHQNRLRKSKVGLSHIDNYTQFQSQKDNYRILVSPRLLTSFRTQASK